MAKVHGHQCRDLCGEKCFLKCSNKVGQQKETIVDTFNNMETRDTQNMHLASLIDRFSVKCRYVSEKTFNISNSKSDFEPAKSYHRNTSYSYHVMLKHDNPEANLSEENMFDRVQVCKTTFMPVHGIGNT
jgi:hypothetical protein